MTLSKFLMASITAGAVMAAAQSAGAVILFTETFDNPAAFDNPANWTTSSSTANGRILRDGNPTTAAGSGAMWMDVSPSGPVNLNEAVLTLDLTGCGPVCWLSFSYAETTDESLLLPASFMGSANGDGVSISDNGTDWHTILNAPDTDFGVWTPTMFDLATEASGAGITLGAGFRIKFQQFDNFPRTTDGRGYDEIVIDSHGIPEPGTLALFGIGLVGLGFARRKKQAA